MSDSDQLEDALQRCLVFRPSLTPVHVTLGNKVFVEGELVIGIPGFFAPIANTRFGFSAGITEDAVHYLRLAFCWAFAMTPRMPLNASWMGLTSFDTRSAVNPALPLPSAFSARMACS